MNTSSTVSHPGIRIRSEIIPAEVSVTKAAEIMGVGRPALSNLLNGKAGLSADMAARLAKAFSCPLKDLMDMQTAYEAAQAKQKAAPANIKAYVPPFLAIKANDIELWASHNIPARSRLAVFLRTLVHSTGSNLSKVDFPGNDDAERPGWDGSVESNSGTPWVPAGRSGWEFGTNEIPKTKADGDFEKSVKSINNSERHELTFVFVTPRRWAGKAAWIKEKKAKGLWKDVRAYDASDIEQWLEQSLAGQTWFANETQIPAQDVRSLDKCWAQWATVSTPSLTGALFNSAIETAKRNVLSRLSRPPESPILIAADSTDEALAFLAQLLSERGGDVLASYRDRVLVFDRPGVLPKLAAGAPSFIAVAFTREVERELAHFAKSMHSFVIYPRNAISATPDVILEPANYETFNQGLEAMGKKRDEITRLSNESGRSLTVLRRRLSAVLAVQVPEWAEDHETAARLVPFMFVGAWNSKNETDKAGLSFLAGDRSYDDLEKEGQRLAKLNDAPIWSIGAYRGVISKIDLLYAIAGTVAPTDLERYFSMARRVLGEDNPALDLEEDQRWAASIHGKTREFSAAFREGISETLVLLAVHGEQLFKGQLGIDVETQVARVVRDLLPTPLTTRVLEANDNDLPTYAEAAPDEFLSIIERDLKSRSPAVLGLLRPVNAAVFGSSPSRTGLLWALEGLSWDPSTLTRAASILARLAQVEINDNWTNKPAHSLESIFRAWMPQTAANHQQRVDLLKKLANKYPDVVWKVCVAQFGNPNQVGDYSHKPRWRPDGYGFGEPLLPQVLVFQFRSEMIEMALNWEGHSVPMLCDLVERLIDMSEEQQVRTWQLIETWAKGRASDAEKATMREKIRVTTLSRRAAMRAKKFGKAVSSATFGKAAYDALEPSDLLNKHGWLFRGRWIDHSADEIEDIAELDFQKREDHVRSVRVEALREIFMQRGLGGILKTAERGNASWMIGALLASDVLSDQELQELLRLALRPILDVEHEVHSCRGLIGGVIRGLPDAVRREAIINAVTVNLSEVEMVELLLLAPFGKGIWKLVDALGTGAQNKYWTEVTPDWIHDSDAENNEAVERLLKAERPRAAFSCIRYKPAQLEAAVLFRLLSQMAQGGKDQPGQFMLEDYYLEEAFKHLNNSPELTLDQKAGLEFAFIDALGSPWGHRERSSIPNLEQYLEANPEFYVQVICWTYKRRDGAADPSEFQVPSERIKSMAKRGNILLDSMQRIPGQNDLGELDADRLSAWISAVREACAELGREDIADICIGKLLAHAPVGKDQVWPCEPVRDAMEDVQSEPMMRGAHTGVYNSRGVHLRGEGGDQERELAEKYRKWSQALQISHPFVASKLLIGLARSYDDDASREDTEAGIRLRLP